MERCNCEECQRLDQMRYQGIEDTYQMKLLDTPERKPLQTRKEVVAKFAVEAEGLLLAAMGEAPFDRYWRIRTNLPERFGQRCRILARGKMNSCRIEFEDGVRHIVSRNSVRKIDTGRSR